MVNKAVSILLLLSPVLYKYGMKDCSLLFEDYMFFIGTVVLFVSSLMNNPVRELSQKWIIISFAGLFLFNVFIHSAMFLNPGESVIKPYIIKYGRSAMLFIIGIVIMVRYIENVESLYKYIVYAVIINLLVFDLQRLQWFVVPCHDTLPGGCMGNFARLSTYLAITLPFVYHCSIYLAPVCVVTSLLIDPQLGCLMSAFIIVFFQFKNQYVRYGLIVLALSLIGYFYIDIFKSFATRLPKWGQGINMLLISPVSGLGFGAIGELTQNLNEHSTISNSILQLILEGGIFVCFWLFYTLKEFFKRFDFSIEAIAVLVLLLNSCFEYVFEIKPLWFTLIFTISAFIIKQIDKRPKNVFC